MASRPSAAARTPAADDLGVRRLLEIAGGVVRRTAGGRFMACPMNWAGSGRRDGRERWPAQHNGAVEFVIAAGSASP